MEYNSNSQNTPDSLYQQTMALIAKLYSVPGLAAYMFPNGIDVLIKTAEEAGLPPIPDPAAILWHVFRLGTPLCLLFNTLRPRKMLELPDVSKLVTYNNVCKKSIFYFMVGVKEEGIVKDDAMFSISELYKNDMAGFVKVN